MKKQILYTTAFDELNALVHINEAEKGKLYYCPQCKEKFKLNKSGKTGKGSKRPYFSHIRNTPNCKPETVLHYSFKRKVVELLENHLSDKNAFMINWTCSSCSNINNANLLAKVVTVREEYNLGFCQPDIALLDAEGKVIIVIEIVVTHFPEERVTQYYRENNIILLQINLTSDEDLLLVREKLTSPAIVEYCLKPVCFYKYNKTIKRLVKYFKAQCGQCFLSIPGFYIENNSSFGIMKSKDFTNDEINIVKSYFPQISIIQDDISGDQYPVYNCLNCRRLRGKYNPRRF